MALPKVRTRAKMWQNIQALLWILPALACLLLAPAQAEQNWPQFRGPNAAGTAEGYPLPVTWNTSDTQTVLWRTAVPGLGHSSPIIWGDRVFVATAVGDPAKASLKPGLYGDVGAADDDEAQEWRLYSFDRTSGEVIWSHTGRRGKPRIHRHTKATHANSTPATDGKHIVTFFGSEGLYCYNWDGELLWQNDFGQLDAGWFSAPEAQWGFGSSPIIHDGMVIVQCDVQEGSFVGAYDIASGREIWKTARDDYPTWGSPTIYASPDGLPAIAVNGYKHTGGYDLRSGNPIWWLSGGGDIPVPTPVTSGDLIFFTSSHGPEQPILAVRTTARGDLTEGDEAEFLPWNHRHGGGYMQTPIVYGDYLFTSKDNGVLSCYRTSTGELMFRERMPASGGFTASPVGGDGKLYFTSEMGDVVVVEAAPEFEVLAVNELGEVCMATPAISEGVIYFRTQHHLVAVGRRLESDAH